LPLRSFDIMALANILRDAARAEALPRFRRLDSSMVHTKTEAIDLVTEADIATEEVIKPRIAEWMPEMREHNAWSWLVLDREGYRAIIAEQMFAPCAAQSLTLQTDQRPSFSTGPVPIWRRFECIANSAGCILGDTIGTAYDIYALRAQDQNARLQVLATLAWLREQPDTGTLAERLARRPADLRSPARDISVTADGRSLEIAQYDTSRGATWSLPLPAYLVESTAASD
jgi:hypothetical protein